METQKHFVREWRTSNWSVIPIVLVGTVFAGCGIYCALNPAWLALPKSPGWFFLVLGCVAVSQQLEQWKLRLPLGGLEEFLPSLIVPIGLLLSLRWHGPTPTSLFQATAGVLIVAAVLVFIAAWRRFCQPMVLRLTEDAIEREGYVGRTPPIPYTEIDRVESVPFGNSRSIQITLLREDAANRRFWWLSRPERIVFGAEVKADPHELKDLIRTRMPDRSSMAVSAHAPV